MRVKPTLLRCAFAASAITVAYSLATPAFAHAICGARTFPATLGIDDPGVGDELALPTLTYVPINGDGVREIDASFSYTKTLLPGLGVSISSGRTWLQGSGAGWGNLDTGLKYNFLCDAPHEFMASVGFDVSWAHTGSANFSDPFNTYSPAIDIGKGLGDLPKSLSFLRPVAITAQFGFDIPGQPHTSSVSYDNLGNPSLDIALNPTVFNWGFTLQYSLPYLNANVRAINTDFFRRLIPITEFVFQRPIANFAQGANVTTGTIQPGVIYDGGAWQLAVEALVPINAASGKHVGAVAELHYYFDDLFPNTLGKPLFTLARQK